MLKFSILLPSRNRLELTKAAIETVRRQSYRNWELVISDNDSEEDYASFIASLGEERIHYSRTERFLSVTENWNRCLNAATGDYIIMLGDDDGLTPGYLDRMAGIIKDFGQPDFIYHGAFHYIYPDAFLARPESRLIDVTKTSPWFEGVGEPGLLDKGKARDAARQALKMKAVYGFNMQYFLYSATFIKKLKVYGNVYQGPFPDFYAAQMSMLLAERPVVVPAPLVFIGISPKSYGFYFYNNREEDGTAFLNSLSEKESVPPDIQDAFLPGSNMNTSWLMSVSIVREKLKNEYPDLALGVTRYRLLQIRDALRHDRKNPETGRVRALWPRLRAHEKLMVRGLQGVLKLAGGLPAGAQDRIYRTLKLSVPPYHRGAGESAECFPSLLAAYESMDDQGGYSV